MREGPKWMLNPEGLLQSTGSNKLNQTTTQIFCMQVHESNSAMTSTRIHHKSPFNYRLEGTKKNGRHHLHKNVSVGNVMQSLSEKFNERILLLKKKK